MFEFVRHWSRRSTDIDGSGVEQGRLVMATEAVASIVGRGETATINAVAHTLGVDQSGASRMVASAVSAGYLTMTPAPSDRRRREATVTRSGRTALRDAHAWQEQVFDELTRDWTQHRREQFQDAMTDLITRSLGRHRVSTRNDPV